MTDVTGCVLVYFCDVLLNRNDGCLHSLFALLDVSGVWFMVIEGVAAPLVWFTVAILLVLELLVLSKSVLCTEFITIVLVHGVIWGQVTQQRSCSVTLEDGNI